MRFRGILRRQAKREYGNPVSTIRAGRRSKGEFDIEEVDLFENDEPNISPYHSREFLNLKEKSGQAAIAIHLETYEYQIHISDCSRQITLHNGVHGDDTKNAFHKIDTLIDELSKFRTHLVSELEKVGELNEDGKETSI